MASTNDLDRLKKSAEGIQATNNSNSESFSRDRVIRAEEVKTGLSKLNGSWASEYQVEDATASTAEAKIRTGLGQVGMGDIDFVPYAENTNRVGGKGAPTLGSPISLEVLGATLKSPLVDWTWVLDPVANTLTITHATKTILSEYGLGQAVDSPSVATLEELTSDFGGLFLLVNHVGNANEAWKSSFSPAVMSSDRAELQLFRVESMTSTTLTLSSRTPLSDYFTTSGDVAGVMFLRKKAARMVEAPQSEGTTFFVMPPEQSSSLDVEPPLSNWLAGDFDSAGLSGSASTYGNRVKTASPVQLTHGGEVFEADLASGGVSATHFVLQATSADITRLGGVNLVGKCLRIVKVDDKNFNPYTAEEVNAFYGYYEIDDVQSFSTDQYQIFLRRATEQSHKTGSVRWSAPDYHFDVKVFFTLHKSVSDLVAGSALQNIELEATRVKALISPSSTSVNEGASVGVSSLMRAKSCSWQGYEPSSLLDLGFGVVVYPAKVSADGSFLTADYDNPLSSSLYSVDYEGATIYLNESYSQDASITNHATNPRKRKVLFISCVALSQEASFGVRLSALENGLEKGAFAPISVAEVLTYPDNISVADTDSSYWQTGTGSIFVPYLTTADLSPTGKLEIVITDTYVYPQQERSIGFSYRGIESVNNGVALHNVKTDFDPLLYLLKIQDALTSGRKFSFTRNGKLTYKQSVLAGRSARSEGLSLTDGSVSYGVDGGLSVSISGLRAEDSTLLYDSSERSWVINSERYEVGLKINRGDLVASNVTELPTTDLSVTPLVLLSNSNSNGDDLGTGGETNDSNRVSFASDQFGDLNDFPDFVGFYLNVEGAYIRSKKVNSFPDGARVILGVDYAGTSANPFQSDFVAYRNTTGSALTDGELVSALNTALYNKDSEKYPLGGEYFSNGNNKVLNIAGRSPSVFPAYSYLEPTNAILLMEKFSDGNFNDPPKIPTMRYLLSLEEVGGNKWVTVAVNVAQTNLPIALAVAGSFNDFLANAQAICDALNEDLYFGHSARLLNRAGFYEGFHQDYDSVSGDVTLNPGLQAKISSYANHTVYGERQVLWITNNDPRHPKYGTTDPNELSIMFICTGRGCGKIPFIEGGISGDNLKDEASKVGNQLINVIASVGRAEQVRGDDSWAFLVSGNDEQFNRIGLYWESETLPDVVTQEVSSISAQATANMSVLGFDRNGFLPVGPWASSSRLIYSQSGYYDANSLSNLELHLEGDLYSESERGAGSPIRSRLKPTEYTANPSRYFDLLPFFGASQGAESYDHLAQSHWLDNPSFSFHSEDDLSEEDLGLYTWASRDYVYPTSTDTNNDSSYEGLICTFSANKRERSSFRVPLMNPTQRDYDDLLVSVTSPYFLRDTYKPSVIEVGDHLYINAGYPSKIASAKIIWRSSQYSGNRPLIAYTAILKGVNGQYGGFSRSSYYQPVFTPHTGATKFHASFSEMQSVSSASVVGGNHFYWTQGNLRSLLTTASVPAQLEYGAYSENRDTGAIDGGFGSFGAQSASLLSGGRLGLFNGLPQQYAGISFASISGGLGTSDSRGGQDTAQGDDELRVFETFLEHGVFSYVSLPSGSGGSFSSTIGHLSRERDKRSDYSSAKFGGSAGLRVSGDIQLFVRNMRILGSDDNTAFVMQTDFAPATNTDFLISNATATLDVSNPILPYNPTGTGPTTSGLQAPKSASGFEHLRIKSQGGAHTPSGVGLFGPTTAGVTPSITDASVRRTATISLGLTLADLKGISNSLGKNLAEASEGRQIKANFPDQFGTEADIGSALFHMAQFASSEIPAMALPALKSAYVALNAYKHEDGSPTEHTDNWGVYKIIDTPVLMPVDASDLEAGQGSRNTLHGYGSNYSAHTRSSLNTIVANIMVRVESEVVRSIYPDGVMSNQGGLSLTPTGLLIDAPFYENTILSRPTQKLGHSWRILRRSAGGFFADVFVFDVVDQGGSPTGAPSDLHGLELNPRALGKESLPAELLPLGYQNNHNADMPSDLEFLQEAYNTETARSNYDAGLRLLGVHRNMNHKGKTTSLAFVSLKSDLYRGSDNDRKPTDYSYPSTLLERYGSFLGDSPARLVVYSSERVDRLDEAPTTTTKSLLENGETGYVSLGYPERFGLGVVLDGGLGVVSSNAVRVHPQKGNFDSLGSLSLYSSPLMDSRLDLRDGNAVSLPSRFNRTEFYGDVVVAGHDSDLVIDDARTVDGAVARMNEAQASAGTTYNYQSRVLRFGARWSQFRTDSTWGGTTNSEGVISILAESLPTAYTNKLSESYLYAPPPPLPNDTLLPWVNAGIRIKTTGTVVYERAFRPQDATGADIVASMAKGAKSDRGLRGLEIPAFGECLLLPKGPSTLGGRVFEKDTDLTSNTASVAYGLKTKIRTGSTPLDLPLYEFYNGPSRFAYGGDFAVTIGNVLQEHGVYGRSESSANLPINNSPKTNVGGGLSNRTEEFDPGILSQGYHHSRSNASSEWGGQDDLLSNTIYATTRTVYLYTTYEANANNDGSAFSVFYRDASGRKVYPAVDVVSYQGTAFAPLAEAPSSGTTFFKPQLATSELAPFPSAQWAPSGSFELPYSVEEFFVETLAIGPNTPRFGVLFYNTATLDPSTQGWIASGEGTQYHPATPFLDLTTRNYATSNLDPTLNSWFLSGVVYPYTPTFNFNLTPNYDYNFNLSESNLIDRGFTQNQINVIFTGGSDTKASPFQVRLMDGMVLEDVTTGTFYTIGEVGRYRGWHSHLKPVSMPGDTIKYSHNNPYFADYNQLAQNPNTMFSRAPIRPMNIGSTIGNNGNTSPEVFYDLSPHFDFEQDCLDRADTASQKNGFGDIADNGYVRRPLVGHKFRVVPNVEFVPVLGHRSVKGGLAIPYDKNTGYTSYINEADAVLYDEQYHFLKSDIGRKIYVCGTYEYALVGWYVIIDIQKDYVVNPYTDPSVTEETFDVAVVRKIKRSGEYERTWAEVNDMPLPMRPRAPKLEASLDASSNGKRIFLDGVEKNYDIHLFDPFLPHNQAEEMTAAYALTGYTTDASDLAVYAPTSALWLGVNVWREDGDNNFFGIKIVSGALTAFFDTHLSVVDVVKALNADVNSNGVRIGRSLSAINGVDANLYTGWANYADEKWIRWSVKYEMQDKSERYPVFSEREYTICGITCEIDTSVLSESMRRNLLNRGCFLEVDFQFHPQIDSTAHISDAKSTLANDRESRGFFRLKGVCTNVSVSWADKNSYYPNQYEGVDATYSVYEKDELDPSFLMMTRVEIDNTSAVSQSATGGVRWVFSAPLLEENVGSYLHLTKPQPYRFGQPTYTQNEKLHNDLSSTFANPFAWASGWQRKKDLEIGAEPFDLGTDIFRVNRCPSTGDILLGGDCESYAVEDMICRTRGGYTQRGLEISYSPLSVMGNWPDTETNNLPDSGALNFPILYALQPVARERIITVKPTSATSSVLMAHGQYGMAPMVIPASPLALDNDNALNIRFTDPLNFRAYDTNGFLIQDSDPTTTPGVDVPTVSIKASIDADAWGSDFVFGERVMMDVSRPWLLMGRESVSQTWRHFATTTVSGATNPLTGNPAPYVKNNTSPVGWLPHTEGGNSESYKRGGDAYNKLTDNSDTMFNAIYTWTPAGEWWQMQTPLYPGFKSAFLNETTPAPTLRIDLTDTFTQAGASGSGLNSPYMGRTPKGARLTRLWVNFGLNGDFSDFAGSLFDQISQEHYTSVASGRLDGLDNTSTRDTRISSAESANYEYSKRRVSNSSMTFNLVVEIPGSIGNSEDSFYMDTPLTGEDWSELGGQEYSFAPIVGSNGTAFGGRSPTASYNHSSNSERYVTITSGQPREVAGKPRFAGGTIVVPLYVNREAGDLMPNVMERHVSVGPVRFKEESTALRDWAMGDAIYGMGAIGNSHTSFIYPEDLDGDTLADEYEYPDMDINSYTPIIWGGQNFYSSNTLLENYFGGGVDRQIPRLASFEDYRSAGVLGKPMPRSSITSGGVLSSFSSGIYSDMAIFSPDHTNFEMALHAQATTGITIAHGGGNLRTLGLSVMNEASDGGRWGDASVGSHLTPQAPKSSPHAFTLALTPVGDGFEAPDGHLTMPKISGGNLYVSDGLYVESGGSGRSFASFGRHGRTLEVSRGTEPKDRRFKVGNWLDKILDHYGIPAQSGSMLPVGARVYLEATVPWARRSAIPALLLSSNNGAWISSVKCAFEVETADGTAWTLDVNTMGED